MLRLQYLALCLFFFNSLAWAEPGFRLLQLPDGDHKDITVGLWYPTREAASNTPNTEFGHALAVDAPFNDDRHPLVLISHGYSGWYGGHADLAMALAEAGFMVAAPSHTGNHFADMSSPPEKWLLDRPRHIRVALDYLLDDALTRDRIDASRIGVYGFSAGGYTALSLVGGVPDLDHATAHCQQTPDEFVCAEGLIDAMKHAKLDLLPDEAWGHDPRIKAAAIAAPALAFAYTAQRVASVAAPVQLWSAINDTSVPHSTNSVELAKRLPVKPETHWIENAGHFSFLIIPCRPAFKKADPVEYEMICGDIEGFDRRAFLKNMGQEMIRFFNEALS